MIGDIEAISAASGHTYGKRRIKLDLNALGHQVGIYKTKRLMDQATIKVIIPRKRHYYPAKVKAADYAPNLLNRNFNPACKNTHWVGDITYISNHLGWSYLATVLDLHTKEIVGWALSQRPDAHLARQALTNAIKQQQPDTHALLFHSDQGTQYAANSFRSYLMLHGITQSMSRRGNCWDNAVMERFFRSLKTERLHHLTFINHQAVISAVNRYIHFYNYKRRHSAIGYLTPHQKSKLHKVA